MDKREEFRKILYETEIANTMVGESKDEIIKIQQWLINNVPSKLYRFRSCDNFSISQLENDEIWGSNIMTFNDPYECIPYYNINSLEKLMRNIISYDNFILMQDKIKKGEMPLLVSKLISNEELKKTQDVINGKEFDNLQNAYDIRTKNIKIYLESNWNNINQTFNEVILNNEKRKLIACFSEDITSTLMWGHYADGHRGFGLEYDFRSIIKPQYCWTGINYDLENLSVSPSIAPIIYNENRFDATTFMLTIISEYLSNTTDMKVDNFVSDVLFTIKYLLTKSDEWQYEKEWRLFRASHSRYIISHMKLMELKPKALYLGVSISDYNEKILVEICKKKDIKCYKMVQNFIEGKYKFLAVPYEIYASERDNYNGMQKD